MDEITEVESLEKVEPFRLKTEIEGKAYEFICAQNSPLAHVFEALGQMRTWCEDRASAALAISSAEEEKSKEAVSESKPIEE